MKKINRENFEAWLLDLAEGNLSAEEKSELMAFLDANPDLKETVDLSEYTGLTSDTVVFENKQRLYRGELNEHNIEWYLAAQAEGDTTEEENAVIEKFIEKHPSWKKQQHLYSLSKLSADESILFENKSSLYHAKTVSLFKRRAFYYAAAAVVSILWMSAYLLFELKHSEKITLQNNLPETEIPAQEPAQGISTPEDSILPSGNPEQPLLKNKTEKPIPDSPKPVKPVYRIMENRPLIADNSLPEQAGPNKSLQLTEVAAEPATTERSDQFEKLESLRHKVIRLIAESPHAFAPGAFDKLIERMADGETDISNSDLLQLLVSQPRSQPTQSNDSKTPILDAIAWSLNKISGRDISIEKRFNEDGRIVAYELDAGLFKIGKDE